MPLPLVKKTWQYAHGSNTLSGSQKPDYDNSFLFAKNALLAFGSNPCTVVGSSDGTTAALDGVDRITASSKIVNANTTSPHSWIVLNLVGMGSAQVMFDWNNSSILQLGITFSPGGLFTGGSTTANPTATDSIVVHSNASQWIGQTAGTGGQFRIHVMRSTDGTNTRVFFCINSLVAGFWTFEKVWNPVSGWPLPYIAAAVGISGNITDTSLLTFGNWPSNTKYSSQGPLGSMPLFLTYEAAPGGGSNAVGSRYAIPNELSGEYPLCPVGLWHDTTVGQRGRHGSIPDMYFTVTGPVCGDTYPSDGSRQFVQMGQMIVPADGTSWLIS